MKMEQWLKYLQVLFSSRGTSSYSPLHRYDEFVSLATDVPIHIFRLSMETVELFWSCHSKVDYKIISFANLQDFVDYVNK